MDKGSKTRGSERTNNIYHHTVILLLKLRIEIKTQLAIDKTRRRITCDIDEIRENPGELQGMILFEPTYRGIFAAPL